MVSVLSALAMQARLRGDFARAEELFHEAVKSDGTDADAWLALAVLCGETGRLIEAAAHYETALALKPNDAHIMGDLGHILARLGKFERALDMLNEAVARDPTSADALASLAGALTEAGRPSAGEETFRRALAIDPANADALNGLGNSLHLQGHYREAIESYRAAVAAKPDFAAARSNLIYTLSLDPDYGPAEHRAERDAWWLAHGAQHAAIAAQPHPNNRDPERRLRVGYVSGNFRRESAAGSFAPVLVAHDPASIELYCYSGTDREDDFTETLSRASAAWCRTTGLSDEALAEKIRADRVDILVDLAGHMYGNRLPVFARRPAPVQVTAWGEPTGTGLRTIDVLFSDPVHIPPDARRQFVETVVDLPCHIHYGRPAMAPEIVGRPHEGPFVFGSLNRLAKLGEATLDLWRSVLDVVPDARLLLKDPAFDEIKSREHIASRLGHGDRIEFRGSSPHPVHLATYNDIDVALDPTPQNGGVTTFEGLWMGVPAIALRGRTPSSRTSAAILSAAGLADFVAESAEAYVTLARQARRDRIRLVALRQVIPARLRSSAMGDAASYARIVEQRYRELWRGWCFSR